jgi:hypothetical protein
MKERIMKKKMLAAVAAVCALVLALAIQGDAATTLAATVRIQVTGGFDNALDLTNVQSPLSYANSIAFTNGTGLNQADVIFTDTRSVVAAEDLDVSAGALQTAFGATFTITELKLLIVCAAPANTANVVLGGDAASVLFLSVATTTTSIKPGGCFVYADPSATGTAVTNSTADIIQVAPSSGTQSYSIIVMGSSS